MAELQLEIARNFIEVITGTESGRRVYVEDEPVIIGTAPDSSLQLNDAAMLARHTMVLNERGVIYLENLASTGTLFNGKLLNTRAQLAVGDQIQIGETILRLGSTVEKKANRENNYLLFALLSLLLVLAIGAIIKISLLFQEVRRTNYGVTTAVNWDWHEAFTDIYDQVATWENAGKLPAGMAQLFAQAWFRDQSGATKSAILSYQDIYTLLSSLTIPEVTPLDIPLANFDQARWKSRFRQLYRGAENTLRNRFSNSKELELEYAHAWWIFIGQRIEKLRQSDRK